MENKRSDMQSGMRSDMQGGMQSGAQSSVQRGTRRGKMPVEQRAKQFMPFAAVTGLDDAIKRVELELELSDRRELSEEAEMALREVDKYD